MIRLKNATVAALQSLAICVLVALIVAMLGLLLPPQPVCADGTQTVGEWVRTYVPPNANVVSVWRYSPYGYNWYDWRNQANQWASACGAECWSGWSYKSSNWGVAVWQQHAQPSQPVANIQTQVPKAPPRQDFVPGWRAYAGAAWEAAQKASGAATTSICALVANMNAVYHQSMGGMYGTYGSVNN